MDLALKAAESAAISGEVPIGCVVVRDNAVIATAAAGGQGHRQRGSAEQAQRGVMRCESGFHC